MAGDSTTIAESDMTSTAAKKAKKKSTAEKKRGLQKSATTSNIPLDKSNLHILDLGRIRRCPNCLRTHDSRVSCEEYQSKCEMIIRENVPKELPSDVVRCNSKSDAGLESLPQINLSSLRQRFESGSESENDINDNNITIGGSNGDINGNGYQRRSSKPLDLHKYGLSRSETVLIRLQRYQSIARGDYRPTMDTETSVDTNHEDKTTNGHENGDHGEEEEHVSKRKEKAVPFARLSALKSQWESGVIVNDDDEDDDNEKTNGHNGNHENGDDDLTKNGDVKEELYKLRQRICLGRSASMRQIYERGLVNNNNNEIVSNKMSVAPMNAHLNAINAGLNGKIEAEVIESAKDKARKVREKFEKGITNGDDVNGGNASDDPDGSSDGDSKLSQLKREKLTDLSVVVEAETAAREAKKIFKQLDQLSLQEKEKDLVNSHRRRVTPSSAKNVQRSSTIANFQTRSPSLQNGDTGINGTTNGTAAAGHASSSDVDSVVCPSNGETLSTHPQPPVIRYCDPVESEDILIDTQQLQERYKFFEDFKEQPKEPKRFEMTPPRDQVGKKEATKDDDKEPPRDPNVVRCLDIVDDIPKTDTTKKMLGVFKQLESQAAAAGTSSPVHGPSRDGAPGTPKPLKRITPPRELADKTDVVDVNNKVASVIQSGLAGDTEVVKSSTKTEDVIPVEPDMTRSLKAKFENWANEVSTTTTTSEVNGNKSYDLPDDYTPSLDMAKNLKAKFESISSSTSDTAAVDKSASSTTVDGGTRKPRVNRFVQDDGSAGDRCSLCGKVLYALEKLEFGGVKIHRTCFKCSHCMSSLRMENYTSAGGKFYCLTHFKQLFMSKGNYDEGFGHEQHKEKWEKRTSSANSNKSSNNNNRTSTTSESDQEHGGPVSLESNKSS